VRQFALLSLLTLATSAFAADELSPEQCAARLQKATATVRVRLHPESKDADAEDPESIVATPQITVCSGVAVSDKLLVTTAFAAADSQIRLTMPGGGQKDAKLRVLDEFSGLALLEAVEGGLEKLPLSSDKQVAGSWVMAAAAWGAEQPLVSVGVIGGLGRSIKGYVYPPLLQCDIRPAETSSGAGLVDRRGNLVGVIVAGDGPEVTHGWMYAVPVSHVQRLLRARNEKASDDSVVVLKRRRPTVGVDLKSTEAGIVVSRVLENSAAEKAGILVGDRIVTAEGMNVRSVYDAKRPTQYKQPGDTMCFECERKGEMKKFELVLGGGVELPGATLNVLGQLVAPKIEINLKANGAAKPARPYELKINTPFSPDKDPATTDKLKVLEKAMDRYRSVIDQQQKELSLRDDERRQQAEQIDTLKSELEQLKKPTAKSSK
jgi:S1-C subfamily serine protease